MLWLQSVLVLSFDEIRKSGIRRELRRSRAVMRNPGKHALETRGLCNRNSPRWQGKMVTLVAMNPGPGERVDASHSLTEAAHKARQLSSAIRPPKVTRRGDGKIERQWNRNTMPTYARAALIKSRNTILVHTLECFSPTQKVGTSRLRVRAKRMEAKH